MRFHNSFPKRNALQFFSHAARAFFLTILPRALFSLADPTPLSFQVMLARSRTSNKLYAIKFLKKRDVLKRNQVPLIGLLPAWHI